MTSDTLATIAMAAALAAAVWWICRTESGAGVDWLARKHRAAAYHRAASARHTAAWLDALGVPAGARDGHADHPDAIEDTSPWAILPAAPIDVLPTVPDIRTYARTP